MMMRAQNETCDATTTSKLLTSRQQSSAKYATTMTRKMNSSGSSPSPPDEMTRSQRHGGSEDRGGEIEDSQSQLFPSPLNLSILEERHLISEDVVMNDNEDRMSVAEAIVRRKKSDHAFSSATLGNRVSNHPVGQKSFQSAESPSQFEITAKFGVDVDSPTSDKVTDGIRSMNYFLPLELTLASDSNKMAAVQLPGGIGRQEVEAVKWQLTEALTEKEQQRVCRWLREGDSTGVYASSRFEGDDGRERDPGVDDVSRLGDSQKQGLNGSIPSGSYIGREIERFKYVTGSRLEGHELRNSSELRQKYQIKNKYDNNFVFEKPDDPPSLTACSNRSQSAQDASNIARVMFWKRESTKRESGSVNDTLRRCHSAEYNPMKIQSPIDFSELRKIELEIANRGVFVPEDSSNHNKRSTPESYWNARNNDVQTTANQNIDTLKNIRTERVGNGTLYLPPSKDERRMNIRGGQVDHQSSLEIHSDIWIDEEMKATKQKQQLDLQKHQQQRDQLQQLLQNSARLRHARRPDANSGNSAPDSNAFSDKNHFNIFSNGWKEAAVSSEAMPASVLAIENVQNDLSRLDEDPCQRSVSFEHGSYTGVARRIASQRRESEATPGHGDAVSTSGRFDVEHSEGRDTRVAAANPRTNKDVFAYVLDNQDKLLMCRFCNVIYTDQILYYLHMGLHNHNSPWQCNLCGVTCAGVQDFTSHVIHY